MRPGWKGPVALLAALALFCAVTAVFSSDGGANQPAYTVFSTGEQGVSVLYDALEKMGYSVKIGFSPVGDSPGVNNIVVIIEPNPAHFSQGDLTRLLNWVRRGGRLILLSDEGGFMRGAYIADLFASPAYYHDDALALYTHGLGEALVGSSAGVTNGALVEDPSMGVFIQHSIAMWGGDSVIFNESAHGFKRNESFFGILPTGLKLFLCQLGLLALMIVWRLGKRFGRPVPYYEELEREDCEAVRALAIIYNNAGKGDVAVESYYERLLDASAEFFGVSRARAEDSLETLWREGGLKHTDDLARVRRAVSSGQGFNTKKRSGRAALMKTVKMTDELTAQVSRGKHKWL